MNKRTLIALVCLFTSISLFAANKQLDKDITMVSYEQNYNDFKGVISLRNNTNQKIHNMRFQIIYLNMSDEQIDYADISREATIEPGMVRRIEVPAYEAFKKYHYYKSKKGSYDSQAFKVKFKLLDYNLSTSKLYGYEDDYEDDYETSNVKSYYPLIFIVILLISLGIYVGSYVLVAVLAKNRNRNVVLWLLLSFVATPILIIIILLCVGNNENMPET